MSNYPMRGIDYKRPDDVPYPDHGEVDRCSCPKGAGVWGQGGWHLTRVPYNIAISHYGDASYAGTVVHLEPCPAYQSAMRGVSR